MAASNQNKNVVFRRVHGHIVPIAVGSSALGFASSSVAKSGEEKIIGKVLNSKFLRPTEKHFGAGFTGALVKGSDPRFQAARNYSRAFNRKYADAIKKAGSPHIQFSVFSSAKSRFHFLSNFVEVKGKNSVAALHELGHAQAHFAKSKSAHFGMVLADPIARLHNILLDSKRLSPAIANRLTAKTSRLYNFAKSSGTVVTEADAWRRAFNMAKGRVMKKAVLADSIKPLLGYSIAPVVKGLRYGLYAAGVGAITYGIFHKDKKNGK